MPPSDPSSQASETQGCYEDNGKLGMDGGAWNMDRASIPNQGVGGQLIRGLHLT